jgi:hypothetical protein
VEGARRRRAFPEQQQLEHGCIRNSDKRAPGAAKTTLSRLLGDALGVPVVSKDRSWWYRPQDLGFVVDGIAKSGKPRVIEIWCEVSADLAWSRYATRQRHWIHPDGLGAEHDWAEWGANAAPLAIGRTIRVDTSDEVDAKTVVARLSAEMHR